MEQPFPFASDSHGLRPSFVNQTLTLPTEMLIGLCRHAAPPKLVPQPLPPSTRHNPEIGIMSELMQRGRVVALHALERGGRRECDVVFGRDVSCRVTPHTNIGPGRRGKGT